MSRNLWESLLKKSFFREAIVQVVKSRPPISLSRTCLVYMCIVLLWRRTTCTKPEDPGLVSYMAWAQHHRFVSHLDPGDPTRLPLVVVV